MKLKYIVQKNKDYYLILLVVLAVLLRLMNLGYSDFQGDEIKALFRPTQNISSYEFLLDQRKGPIQFIVTGLVGLFDNNFSSQFLARLPFALAGILAVVYFYKLLKIHFDNKVAFYSAFFLATNGFFIAFSRLVQYQSFVILFDVLALYFLTLAVKRKGFEVKGIYLGFIFWALSVLSHYDGIFIAPFVLYLLIGWWKKSEIQKLKLKTLLFSGLTFLILVGSFYIPFIFSISSATKDYWAGRITGDVSAKLSSSRYLFTVYQPIYAVHIYTILGLLGVLSLYKRRGALVWVFAWLLIPLLFLEKFVYIPGTHIYTYLLPAFVFLAFGVISIERAIKFVLKGDYNIVLRNTGLVMVLGFLFLQSYMVFVDNKTEYPWKDEKFLLWTFPHPSPIYHLSMFGFPYNRNWEGIQEFTRNYSDITAYSTNERKSIPRFYVPLEKSSEKAGFYIYIRDPQSFTNEILSEKAAYWVERYKPQYTFTRNGETLSRVYVMPVGTLAQIMEQGY
ncbi:glycosyltransferase family 39 protein [bacterium]|nr:glycosyltransferase family 39 protein [bacterium]